MEHIGTQPLTTRRLLLRRFTLDDADAVYRNWASDLEKCGMRYEGTLRAADWNNQGICDAAYYALLKTDR